MNCLNKKTSTIEKRSIDNITGNTTYWDVYLVENDCLTNIITCSSERQAEETVKNWEGLNKGTDMNNEFKKHVIWVLDELCEDFHIEAGILQDDGQEDLSKIEYIKAQGVRKAIEELKDLDWEQIEQHCREQNPEPFKFIGEKL